jgi:rubrerythrin
MKNNNTLLKMFEDLYYLEKEAKELYEELLGSLQDDLEIKTITKIRDDEIKHMEIARQLINSIKNEN